METIISPHDRYFRSAMADLRVAKDFFYHHLPEKIRNKIDLNSLKLRKESYIDKQLKLNITDILYSVNVQQKSGYIYLLVEHQSTADVLMPFRMLKYIFAIMDQHLKGSKDKILPLVIPMVFYHGQPRYPHSTNILDLFAENKQLAEEIVFKPFQLIDMSNVSDEEIRQRQWCGIMEFVTKHIFARDFLPHLYRIKSNLKLLDQWEGNDYIVKTMFYAYTSGNISDEKAFVEVIREALSPKTGEEIMTLAELHTQRGRQEGIKVGKKEVAYNLLHRGYSVAQVAEITGLSGQEIANLRIVEREKSILED